MRFSEISIRQAKSKIKAGEGLDCGTFKFFTSGVTQSKFLDTAQYQGPALIFGTGGSPSIHYCEDEFSTSTDCVVYYPSDDSVDFYCAFQFFKSHMYLLEKGFRGAGLKHIKKEYIENIEINWPNEEQRNVITVVSKNIDDIIAKRSIQLDKLETLSSALFYEMFGDPVKNEKEWDAQPLKFHTTKIGSGATPKGGNESYKSEGIPLIRSLNVYNGCFRYKDLAHIDDEQAAALDNVTLLCGDVLLNITGASVARCCVVPSELASGRVNQHVAIIRPRENLMSVFLCAQLISAEYQQKLLHDSKSNGATREALTKSKLENMQVILPPLPLQQEFADKISRIEKQKELIRSSVEKLELLKNSLMQQYFA